MSSGPPSAIFQQAVGQIGRRGPAAVLYLDFDGVLHSEHVYRSRKRGTYIPQTLAPGRTLFEWAGLLVHALAPYPELALVLATSWVRVGSYSSTTKRLPPELRERVIGATYHRGVHGHDYHLRQSFIDTPRGLQVLADVGRRRPRAWLALDDDADDWPEKYRDHLVLCDGALGLSKPETLAELESKLARIFEALRNEGES